MKSFNVRLATPQDIGSIDRLLIDLAACLGLSGAYTNNQAGILQHGFGDGALFHCQIADDGNDSVGIAVYFPEYSTWKNRPGVFLQDLYVAEHYRRDGLGRSLLESTMSHAVRLWQAKYMRLAVHNDNERARRFYRELGFVHDDDNLILTAKNFTPVA